MSIFGTAKYHTITILFKNYALSYDMPLVMQAINLLVLRWNAFSERSEQLKTPFRKIKGRKSQ